MIHSVLSVDFAPLIEQDLDYLYELCEATMSPSVIALWGTWNQLKVRKHLQNALARGEYRSIMVEGERVGAISVLPHNDALQLAQIYIMPNQQRRGIGSAVVRSVLSDAQGVGKTVRLSLLVTNPAQEFYARLGFAVTTVDAERCWMEYAVV